MDLSAIMGNERAQAHYLAVTSLADPLYLADQYKLAKLADDKDLMLAIELHLRQTAQVYFGRADVRQGLAEMERIKAERRPGNGGTRELHWIADEIERKYRDREYDVEGDKARFTLSPKSGGTLRLGCINRPGAVAWMAAKYRRGMPKSRAGRYGMMNV